MAGRGNGSASHRLLIIVGSLALLQLVAATTFPVGGEDGWTVPNDRNGLDYSVDMAKNTYYVGDVLEFTYNKDVHNVISMSGDAFLACDVNNPAVKVFNSTGSTSITLKTPGMKFYACQRGQHCVSGQKFSIMVLEAEAGAPGSSPSPDATPGSSTSLAIHFAAVAAVALAATALLL